MWGFKEIWVKIRVFVGFGSNLGMFLAKIEEKLIKHWAELVKND